MPQRATYYGIKSAKLRILFKSPRVINVGFQSVFQLDFSALVILEICGKRLNIGNDSNLVKHCTGRGISKKQGL